MKKIVLTLAAFSAFAVAAPVLAADEAAPAVAAKPGFSTGETDIGTLLDNAATKAVLEKHIPAFVSNPQIDMARSMTLKMIQAYAADSLTDDVLAKIDADLAAIPAAQ